MTTPNASTQTLDAAVLVKAYKESKKRLLLLDYDGTLVNFFDNPTDAKPDAALKTLVTNLSSSSNNNTVAIVSGRDKDTLLQWWADIPNLQLVAEHGAWRCEENGQWRMCRDDLETTTSQWKSIAMPILQDFTKTVEGSFVEVKNFSVVWHCRQSDPQLAKERMAELQRSLESKLADLPVGIHIGAMIVELKNHGVNKGAAVREMLQEPYDFVYIAGDDYTDEDMFAQADANAFTIKVGDHDTCARFRVRDPKEHKALLQNLLDE